MIINKILITLILFLTMGCSNNGVIEKEKIINDNIRINIKINKIKTDKPKNISLVYGELEIVDKSKHMKSFNLDSIVLKIQNGKSDRIYVNSIAYILTHDYPAINGKIKVKVYWLFHGDITDYNIKNLEIMIKTG